MGFFFTIYVILTKLENNIKAVITSNCSCIRIRTEWLDWAVSRNGIKHSMHWSGAFGTTV